MLINLKIKFGIKTRTQRAMAEKLLLITLKGLVFGGDKKAETEYKHKTKLNNK